MTEQTRSLLSGVALRMYAGRLLRRLGWAIAIGLAVGIVALLVARLTGSLELVESRWLLVAVPAVAAAGVLLLTRKPAPESAASLVDDEAATGDLFLTTVSLDDRPDGYEPLVAAKADAQAKTLEPNRLVDPFRRLPIKWLALGLVLALAADRFTPLLDPFHTIAEARESEEVVKQLAADIEQTKIRKAELEREDDATGDDVSPEVAAALREFDATMAQMRPEKKDWNKDQIAARQRQMGKLWEKARERLSQELMNRNAAGQKFGGETAKKHQEWKEQLQKGDPEGIREELEQIKELLQEAAAQQGDGTAEGDQAAQEKREELMRKAESKMAELQEFAEQQIGSEQLAEAMERAMRQMDAAQQQELTEQALEAMRESGELSEMEVEQIAQAARDLEAIEEALETLQEMREMQGRNDGEFDPTECEDCETASDYREFYREQLAQQREGEGGDGGGGRGERDEGTEVPPVDESEIVSEGFKKEVAESYLKKGQMLMSLSGKGEGSMDEEEVREFEEVRRAVSREAIEAVELEDIPPGYQDRIKKYFRTMEAE